MPAPRKGQLNERMNEDYMLPAKSRPINGTEMHGHSERFVKCQHPRVSTAGWLYYALLGVVTDTGCMSKRSALLGGVHQDMELWSGCIKTWSSGLGASRYGALVWVHQDMEP